MATTERFKEAVSELIHGDYTLDDGTKVRGNSLSYLKDHLRSRGWAGMSDRYNFITNLEKAGFKVSPGRGMRVYHGGIMKLGVRCDVVWMFKQ